MRRAAFFALVLISCSTSATPAADWPQHRYDAARSAASPQQLPEQLHLKWVRHLPAPRPAFPDELRLAYDATYQPVVLGKRMFVPSMTTDTVTALSTDTGEILWTFFTDGPVRFAPLAHEDKVYAVSDDGHLYCLDAAGGRLLWKFRGLPADKQDRKVFGNGRLISLWPARGGPVLADGVVYFAAGIWPDDGVYIHALDADSGKPVWSNTTSNRIPKANMDHGQAHLAGLTPQGHLAIVGDKLVVPCGAQLPAFLDIKTGELEDYTMGWGGRVGLPKGSSFVAAAGRYLSHSGDLYDITRRNDEKFLDARGRPDFKNMLYPGGYTRVLIDPTNQRALGEFRQPVITANALYQNDGQQGITAFDLTDIKLTERNKLTPTKPRAADRYPDKWKGEIEAAWRLPSGASVQIKAGNRLYVTDGNQIQAIDIPADGAEPRVGWRAKLDSAPHTLLAADDKLFAVTRDGHIHAFGAAPPASAALVHKAPLPEPGSDDKWSQMAADVLRAARNRAGYALVLGVAEGRLVDELLWQSNLYVIAVDDNPTEVAALRKKLHAAGMYGTRATVHVGDPLKYPFPPYMANLVVTEQTHQLGDGGLKQFAAAVYHPLRPYGGAACFGAVDEQRATVVKAFLAADLPGAVVRHTSGYVVLVRGGPLPKADDWSHEGANAANANASQDRFLAAPLAMLWFDGSLRWHRKPGSADVRVAGGRVIVKADRLYAIDVYTGRHLWEKELPPAFSRSEFAAVDDKLYVAAGRECLVLDASTGEQTASLAAPESAAGAFSQLRVVENRLVGVIGKHVVCLDANSGESKWSFECGRTQLSLAVGGGRVFCSELISERRGETAASADAKARALDLDSGEVLWEIAGGASLQYSQQHDLLVTPAGVFGGKDGQRLRDAAPSPQLAGENLISGSTDSFVVYDLASGEAQGDELKWYRRGCTGLRSSCNLVTTRFQGNAAYVDLDTRQITPLWNIRSGCNNNLFPANGILNVPNVTGGCECNYTPASKAFAPLAVIRGGDKQ